MNLTIAGTTYTMGSACTFTLGVTVTTTFSAGSGLVFITTNGKTHQNINIASGGGGTATMSLVDNLTATGPITLTTGTLDTNGVNVQSGFFDAGATGTKTLTFVSGTWTLTSNNSTMMNWNATGTTTTTGGTWVSNYTLGAGTRTFTLSTVDIGHLSITGGTDTITITGSASVTGGNITNMNFTGFAGTLSNNVFSIGGNLTISSGMTCTAGTNAISFVATSGTKTITSNSVTLDFPLTFNGVGGTWQLQDSLAVGTTRTVTLTNGKIDANNNAFTMGLFSSSNSNVRTITMGNNTWTLNGTGTVWTTATTTNLTFQVNTSTLVISNTSSTGKTFTTGGLTFNIINYNGDNITLTDSHTVLIMNQNNAGLTNGLKITSGQTVTIGVGGDFRTNGISGSLAKLLSTTAGSAHTLTKASGQICVDFMSIKDSTATGGASWRAGVNSTNVSGNTGWVFTTCPVKGGGGGGGGKDKKLPKGKRKISETIPGVVEKKGFLIGRFNIYTQVSAYISRFFHMFG